MANYLITTKEEYTEDELKVGNFISRVVNTMKEFGEWLEHEGLQAIATRVSTGDECSIIIEDGEVVENTQEESPAPKISTKWKIGGNR